MKVTSFKIYFLLSLFIGWHSIYVFAQQKVASCPFDLDNYGAGVVDGNHITRLPDNDAVILRIKRESIFLERYDASLEKKWSTPVYQYLDKSIKRRIYYFNGQVHLVTTERKGGLLKAFTFDPSTGKLQDRHTLARNQPVDKVHLIRFSPDSSYIMAYLEEYTGFLTEKLEAVHVVVFNQAYEEVSKFRIKPGTGKKEDWYDMFVDHEGRAYGLIKGKDDKLPAYRIVQYTNKGKPENKWEIPVSNTGDRAADRTSVEGVEIIFDPEQPTRLYMVSLINTKRPRLLGYNLTKPKLVGLAVHRLDLPDGKVKRVTGYLVQDDFIDQVRTTRKQDNINRGAKKLKYQSLVQVTCTPDNDLIAIAEYRYTKTRTKSSGSTQSKAFAEEVLIFSFNPQAGKLNWKQAFGKKQMGGGGKYTPSTFRDISFGVRVFKDGLFFVSHESNQDGRGFYLRQYRLADGKLLKKTKLTDGSNYIGITPFIHWYDPNHVMLNAREGAFKINFELSLYKY